MVNMISSFFSSFTPAMYDLVRMVNRMFSAMGAWPYIVSAVLIVLIVSLILMPLRGGSSAVGGLTEYTLSNKISSGRVKGGKYTDYNSKPRHQGNYKGKYSK